MNIFNDQIISLFCVFNPVCPVTLIDLSNRGQNNVAVDLTSADENACHPPGPVWKDDYGISYRNMGRTVIKHSLEIRVVCCENSLITKLLVIRLIAEKFCLKLL